MVSTGRGTCLSASQLKFLSYIRMDYVSKGMSTSLNNSLNYRHSGRTWSTTPYNMIKDAQITIPSNHSCWQHMVFSLDKKFLRNCAIGFDQFREDRDGKAWLKVFSFFITLADKLVNDGFEMPGLGSAVFLEWIKASTTDKHVGVRIHLFSNRKCSSSKCQSLVHEMIESNAIKAKKQGRKALMNVMPHDSWQSITSYFEYARQICDVYKNDHSASSDMDNPKVCLITHKTHPLQVFSIDSKSFAINGGQESQNNINNYKFGNAFTFPDMNRVYRMMPSDLNIDKFFRKYLPDYFFTRVKFPEAIIYDDDDNEDGFKMYVLPHLDRDRYQNVLDERCVRKETDHWYFNLEDKHEICEKIKNHFIVYEDNNDTIETGSVNAGGNWCNVTSKMDSMRFQDSSITADSVPTISPLIQTLLTDKHSLSDIDVLRIRAEYKQTYIKDRREFQEDMVEEFCERVWYDVHADVSEPARMILLWKRHQRKDEEMNFQFKKLDPDMSVFANRVIRTFEFFDHSLFVSAQHKTLYLLNHSKYDAYRTETNLHFNSIYTGEGATSKSFLFDKMTEMSITGTISTLTYATTRADAIDGDQIDVIEVFNEAPPGMFMSNKHSDGTQEAMFKNKLTEQVVKVKEFWRDENTGERKNRIAKSQAIGVAMGATNDNPSDCSEAMATRFFWGQFEKCDGKGRSIGLCMRGDRELKSCPEALANKNKMLSYFKEEQMRVYLIFKFIYMKILTTPTLKAADIVYDEMTTDLKNKYKVNIPPRTKERFEILCTILTIVNALEIVFNVEGGKHAGTADVPNEFHPIQLLDIEPFLYCTEEIAVFALTHISEEIFNPNEYKVLKAMWGLHKKTASYREEVETTVDGKRIAIPDYNYIKLNSGKRLLTEIINNIPATAGKMSKHNVQGILNVWNERCINTKVYQESAQVMMSDRVYKDGMPEPFNGNKDKKIALIFDMSHTYVHVHLFRNVRQDKYVDIVKESIKTLQHKYAVPYRKYILGSNRREMSIVMYPHLLDTISLSRNENKTIVLLNPLYTNGISQQMQAVQTLGKRQKNKVDKIRLDLTSQGAIAHAKILGKPIGFAKGSLERFMSFPISTQPINYPDTFLGNVDHDTNETDDEFEQDDFDSAEIVDVYDHYNKRQRI